MHPFVLVPLLGIPLLIAAAAGKSAAAGKRRAPRKAAPGLGSKERKRQFALETIKVIVAKVEGGTATEADIEQGYQLATAYNFPEWASYFNDLQEAYEEWGEFLEEPESPLEIEGDVFFAEDEPECC